MTGNLQRKLDLGIDAKTVRRRSWSANKLVFPACRECNNEYSGMESEARRIVEHCIEASAVSTTDLSVLLDWLDKVRVGLWHGLNRLDGDLWGATPNFHIGSRLGTKDRMVLMVRLTGASQRLRVFGPLLPVFRAMPSVFALQINSLILVNLSLDGLVAQDAGFPYVAQYLRVPGTKFLLGDMNTGTEAVEPELVPVLPRDLVGLRAYQVCQQRTDQFEEWHRERWLDPTRGLSKVIVASPGVSPRYTLEPELVTIPVESAEPDHVWEWTELAVATSQVHLQENHASRQGREPWESELVTRHYNLLWIEERLASMEAGFVRFETPFGSRGDTPIIERSRRRAGKR